MRTTRSRTSAAAAALRAAVRQRPGGSPRERGVATLVLALDVVGFRFAPSPAPEDVTQPDAAPERFPIVGIGASAGGLEAFTQLLNHLPRDAGMGYVLVQHLDPEHESALTNILSRATSLPVSEAASDVRIEPDHVYVIPRDTLLTIAQGRLQLHPRPKSRTPTRSIDRFFESLAEDQHERAIGVVLSGTANDGTMGLEAIKAEGGITFAQDDSAAHDSMPRSAVAAGCVDFVLSPAGIAAELARIAKHPYLAGLRPDDSPPAEKGGAEAAAHEDDETALPSGGNEPRDTALRAEAVASTAPADGYKRILALLHQHSGVDFSLYRSTTIRRRIARRLVLSKHASLEDYASYLRDTAKELDALYSDVLICVTSFFRNPEAFDALQRVVLPKLLAQRSDEPVRVWVLGCSTGQEAYSIAMAFVESAERAPRTRPLSIFSTDLNEKLLEKARHGLYPKSLAQDISPERLRRFFVEEQGGYRVSKKLREMVVFARQDLTTDPPFSRMDVISCRNLLIYLEPALQKKVLPTFHYALKPGGFLLLGNSESIGGFTDLFEPIDKKHKIFAKKPAPTSAFHLPLRRPPGERSRRHPPAGPESGSDKDAPAGALSGELNAVREADRVAVREFAPPGVLVDDDLQVLQFRGAVGPYLAPPPGKASFDLLKMAREGLMLPLRAAVDEARKRDQPARTPQIPVNRNGEMHAVRVAVIPLKNLRERCFLVAFEETDAAGSRVSGEPAVNAAAPPMTKTQEAARIAELEVELKESREYLQSLAEQQEAANEELQAANEEVQSANEELQSINEELETSKEELESANEELTTVNEEMAGRNVELNRLNDDLVNLQASTKIAVVLLARDLTIRRFSANAEKELGLVATDVGRPIGHIRHGLVRVPPPSRSSAEPAAEAEAPADLEALASETIASVREQEAEVRHRDGRWYSLRVRPYMTLDNRVDGAVLVMVDIDALKRSERAIAEARDYAQNTVETVRDPMLVLDRDLRVESANRAFYRTFHVAPAAVVGRLVYDLGNRQWDVPGLRDLLEGVLARGLAVEDFAVEREFDQLGRRTMVLNARRMRDPVRNTERILLAIEDVTERRRGEVARALLAEIVASSDDAIISQDMDGVVTSWNKSAERLFGWSADELLGKPGSLLIPPDRATEESLLLERVRRGERVARLETMRRCKKGDDVEVSLTVSPVHEAAGRVVGTATLARDISELKAAERKLHDSEVRYRRMFQSAKDGILILDAVSGKIVDANAYMSGLVGRELSDLVGRELWEIGLFEDAAANEHAFRELLERGYFRSERVLVRKPDGEATRVDFICNVYTEEDHRVVQCNVRDITQRAEMQREIERQRDELADQHRRKDEFIAMLSHELRNPLAPILNATHILKLQERGSENLAQVSAREVIERQVANLRRLVSDLLEVSAVVRGRIRLDVQTLDLNRVLKAAIETTAPLVKRRGHTVVTTPAAEPVWVRGDPTRLEQVVVNLVNNAAKYTKQGGRIELECAALGDEAVLRVRDNGIGIAPELVEHGRIFDLFTQGERTLDRAEGGLGIGLALAHRLMELHDGSIEVHSAGTGKGSEFVVRLPRSSAPGEPERPAASDSDDSDGKGLRVLVVDDNEDACKSLADLMRFKNYGVQVAHSGPTALAKARAWRPDVVLLDIGLPEVDGYEVAKRLRADLTTKDAKIVAVSGYGNERDVQLGREAGFDAHLVKPVDFEELAGLLAAWEPGRSGG